MVRVLDVDLVRRRRAELGLSLREVAEALGMTAPSYTAIENGRAQAELNLGTVLRLARVLALTLGELVPGSSMLPGGAAPESDTAVEVGDDAVRLGRMLAAVDTTVPAGALAEITGWPPSRIRAARAELDIRLAGCGMRVREVNGALGLAGDGGSPGRTTVARISRAHLARDHLSIFEATLLAAVGRGSFPKLISNPERVALGVLVRGELVEAAEADGTTRERALRLSDDVRFSLMMDERPQPPHPHRPSTSGRRTTNTEEQ